MFNFLGRILIPINNMMLQFKKRKVEASEILLLLPRCLQHNECRENVVDDFLNCKRCGKCPIADIKPVAEKYGIPVCLATGTHMAREAIKKHKPKMILAVACERELLQGIVAVFPRPVRAIANERPNGPCKNTQVDAFLVEDAIKEYVKQ